MTDPDAVQRALLGVLLETHPSMLTTEEARRQLSDVPELDEALELLLQDGLATRLGELLGASRAAVRTRQLTA
jgi:hypothetical protein